jgi:hypothetical protein
MILEIVPPKNWQKFLILAQNAAICTKTILTPVFQKIENFSPKSG